jgi:hypothetical protein
MKKYSVGTKYNPTSSISSHRASKKRKRVLRDPLEERSYELLWQCPEMKEWSIESLIVSHPPLF